MSLHGGYSVVSSEEGDRGISLTDVERPVEGIENTSNPSFSERRPATAVEPLKPFNSSSSPKELLMIFPASLLSLLNYFRRRPSLVVLLLILITVADLVFFFFHFATPKLHNVEIFLDPVAADAKVSVQGNVQMSTATVAVDLHGISCSYLYRSDPSKSFSSAGEIYADFPGAQQEKFGADISLKNTHYSTLRKIVHDFFTRLPVSSQMQLNCDISFTASWYFLIPISTTIPINQVIDIQSLKSTKVNNEEDKSSSLQPRISIEPLSDSSLHSLHFLMDLKVHSMRKKLKVDSFIVHVPKIVYVSTLVDRATSLKSFLRLRTKPLTLDLAQIHPNAQVDVKVSCTPAVSGPDQIHNTSSAGACTLLSPVDFSLFNTELQQNKFINISSYSLAENFISSFLGEYHFIQSIDNSLYPGNAFSDDDSASSHRLLGDLAIQSKAAVATTFSSANTISSGANCVTVNSDGVYISQTCAVVEAGFFKIYIGVYSTEGGFTGYAKSVTSWSPNGEVIDSELEVQLTTGDSEYGILGGFSFSIPDQNMTFLLAVNQTDAKTVNATETVLLEDLRVEWDFTDPMSHGEVEAQSLMFVSGAGNPIKTDVLFNYGNHMYLLDILVSDYPSPVNLGQTFKAYATGFYAGDWNTWHWTLSKGLLSYETSEIGSAQALLGFTAPPPGESGMLFTSFQVLDGQTNDTVMESNVTSLSWQTQEGWLEDGQITVYSLFQLMDGLEPLFSWKSANMFQYANHSFILFSSENPLFVNDSMPVHHNHSSNSTGVQSQSLTLLSLQAEPTDIETARFWREWTMESVVNHAAKEVFIGQDHVDNTLGAAFVRAQNNYGGISSVSVRSQRLLAQSEEPFGPMPYQFLLVGAGAYGGDWNEWHVELNGSALVIEQTLLGFAVGDLSYATISLSDSNPGVSGRSVFHAAVFYPDETPVMLSTEIASWQSATDDWAQAGDLYLMSATDILHAANWNLTTTLQYGDYAYFATFNESDFGADAGTCNIAGKARGTYHSFIDNDALQLVATLDQSSLVVMSSYVGSAEGTAYGIIGSEAETSTFVLTGKAYDAASDPYAMTVNTLMWGPNSTETWLSSGKVMVMSQFCTADSASGMVPSWDAVSYFNYGEEQYIFYVAEQDMYFNTSTFSTNSDVSPTTRALQGKDVSVSSKMNIAQRSVDSMAILESIHLTISTKLQSSPNSNSTSGNSTDANFLVTAMGTYSGSSFLDWDGSLLLGQLVLMQEVIGYARGSVDFDVSNSGDFVNVWMNLEVVDESFTPEINTYQSVQWQSSMANWQEAGQVRVHSDMYLNPALVQSDDDYYSPVELPSWNASMSFQFANHNFMMSIIGRDYDAHAESYAPDTNMFLLEGFGNYGGDWEQWQATLLESTMVLDETVLGHAQCFMKYSSMGSIDSINGSAVFDLNVMNASFSPYFHTMEFLTWTTMEGWWEDGQAVVGAVVSLQDNFFVNSTVLMAYEDNQYYVQGDEFECFSGADCFLANTTNHVAATHWMADAYGNYSVTGSDWEVFLTRGQLKENGALVGYSIGDISGISESNNWLEQGFLHYRSLTRDSKNALVLKTDGRFLYSPQYISEGGFLSSGLVKMQSLVDMPILEVNWNVTGVFNYGHHAYLLQVTEQDYNSGLGNGNFSDIFNMIAMAQGGYGGNSVTQAWMSVTDSLFELQNFTYANVRAYLSTDIPDMYNPTEGSLIVNAAYYIDTTDIPLLYPTDTYPSSNDHTLFWTNNAMHWEGGPESGFGYVSTNTSLYESSLFTMNSLFNASFVNTNAYFSLSNTLTGEAGVDLWARADYDMASGMIANMGGELYFKNQMLFGANTAYDMQTETAPNPDYIFTASPSVQPTMSPTAEHTFMPTNEPTTSVQPTMSPTAEHTFLPTNDPTTAPTPVSTASPTTPSATLSPIATPTWAPTIAVTFAPSLAPTMTPTYTPTMTPTYTPTMTPTYTPTMTPTYTPTISPTAATATQIGVSQTILNLNATLFNSNANYTLALKQSIASCMSGVSASDIINLKVVNTLVPTRRHLRDRTASVTITFASSVASLVTYEVYIANPDSQLSYQSLTEQLTANVQNGNFDAYLVQNAEVYSVPDLGLCTSLSVETSNLAPASNNNDNKNMLGTSDIVGIAIGSAAGLILMFAALYFAYVYCAASPDSGLATTGSAKSASDSEKNESAVAKVASAPPASPVKIQNSPSRPNSTAGTASTNNTNMFDNPMRDSIGSNKQQRRSFDERESKTLPKKLHRDENSSMEL